VIGGRSGGIPDAVIDEVTGLLVNPEDAGEIADAVVRLLSDDQLAARLGAEGRRRAQEELSWENYVSAFDRVIASVGDPYLPRQPRETCPRFLPESCRPIGRSRIQPP